MDNGKMFLRDWDNIEYIEREINKLHETNYVNISEM